MLTFQPTPVTSFHFKPFQKADLARAAMKDAAILAWEPGMGKTLAIFAWPLLKEARRVLIVAPESLHLQIRDTGRQFFGITVRPLPHQDAFRRWKLGSPPVETKPKFYLTSYHQLGLNGADEWHSETPSVLTQERRLTGGLPRHHWDGIGFEADDIRCVFLPSLSTMVHNAQAFDCVVVDEGTRLQGDDSLIAAGVRRLNPRLRLVLSATPIKNRLTSLFWLADWIAQGQAGSSWPYPSSEAGKKTFAKDHLERDQHLTRAQESGKKPTWRQTPRITNQHDLWRLLAPLVIRRRKTDCGEQIVAKNVRPVWCPPGAAQIKSYVLAALNPPSVTKAGTAPSPMSQAVMQLNTLRQICLCPDSPNLGGLRTSAYTPKMAAIVGLVDECRARGGARGEQVVIGSTYQHFGTSVTALLRRRGLRVVMLDGRTDGAKRAEMSLAFKKGEFDVMVAGLSSMGEGHSWECCPNLILPSLEWAYDLNEQFINRVWRINSPKPVNIYPVLIRGTVDEKLFDLFIEKDNASHLSLDGEFLDQPQDEADFEDFVASLANGLSLAGVDEAGIEVALAG